MEEHDELARIIGRLERTVGNAEHPIRRLKAVIQNLEKAGLLDMLRTWIHDELCRIEGSAHDVNEAIDRLANKIAKST